MNLLIIDDEPFILEIMGDELRSEGYQVETASSVAKSLELIDKIQFDVILSDINVPVGGYNAIKRSLNSKGLRPHIYLMTGSVFEPEDLEGVRRFFRKPFDTQELIDELSSLKL